MADQPDLVPEVVGLWELPECSPPWFLKCRATNKGKGPAGKFEIRLDIYDEAPLTSASKIVWFCIHPAMVEGLPGGKLAPKGFVVIDFQLPEFLPHTDLGVEHVYAVTIVGPADDANPDNNVIVLSQAPPMAPLPAKDPPPPPPEWGLQAAGIKGKKNAVTAHVTNQTSRTTRATMLEMHLRPPKSGAATGAPELAATAKVPAMPPGSVVEVVVEAAKDFVIPEPGPVRKGQLRKFTTLVPFSLAVKGTDALVGYGPIPGNPKGKIKFPGKK